MRMSRNTCVLGLAATLMACTPPAGLDFSGRAPSATADLQAATGGLQAVTATPQATVDAEKQVIDLINQMRVNVELPVLRDYEPLNVLARSHSRDMDAKGYLGEVDPDGKTLADRLSAADFVVTVADGLVDRLRPVPYPALVFLYTHEAGWLRANENRAKLQDSKHTSIGVGIVRSINGYVYGTLIVTNP
jgi:uncharacterized protein YkwD